MCKHVLNAQVSIRANCCKEWFDCPECHREVMSHELRKAVELAMACKKCKKVFYKDMSEFDETDEYCPYCDNHYIIPAVTPEKKTPLQPVFVVDGRDPHQSRQASLE